MSDIAKQIQERNAAQRLNIFKGFKEADGFFEKANTNGTEAKGDGGTEDMNVTKEEKDLDNAGDDDDNVEKGGGAGSRGGNILGYDKAGKPIYASAKAQANIVNNNAKSLQEKIDAAVAKEKKLNGKG